MSATRGFRPGERSFGVKEHELPVTAVTQHVLDGQQRITSLFAAAQGLVIKREDRSDDFSQLYIDLEADEDEPVVIAEPNDRDPGSLISVTKLLSAGVQVLSKYPAKHHGRLDTYKQRLTSYSFSVVLVKEAPIDIATEIPVAFPPVIISVEAEGKQYDEMHVDGGTGSQVFVYPADVDWRLITKKLKVRGKPQVYVIRNSFLDPDYNGIQRRVFPIASRTIDSLIRTQGIGALYQIYALCKRDGNDFNLAYIPSDFMEKPAEAFDPVYMKKLLNYGYQKAVKGYPWQKAPPGFILEPSRRGLFPSTQLNLLCSRPVPGGCLCPASAKLLEGD